MKYQKLILFLFVSFSLLMGCSNNTDEDLNSVSIGLQLEPPVLDPTINPAAAIAQITLINIFEGLTRVNESGEVLPGLAQDWEISPNGLNYKFNLRKNIFFSDGTKFDSSDVLFTFNKNAAEDSNNPRRSYFTQINKIEILDEFTVVISLENPSSLFLFNLAENVSVIVAPESSATNSTNPVGTGPFRISKWIPGESVELVKNLLYRDVNSIALDRVVFKFIGDPASQITALLAGDIDYLPNIAAIEQAAQIENDDRFRILSGTTEGETILAINNSRPPFDNILVRRALSHAVNREEVISGAMFGFGEPIGTHFSPHHPAYLDLTETYPHSIELAKQLLKEADIDQLALTITLPPTTYARRSGEIIASQLQKVGIEVNLEPVEWALWLDTVYSKANYDLTIVSHVEPMDIGIYANPDYYFRYNSEIFQSLIDEANSTTDIGKNYKLLQDAQRILAEDAVNVFLFELPKVGAANALLNGLWKNAPMFLNDMGAVNWSKKN